MRVVGVWLILFGSDRVSVVNHTGSWYSLLRCGKVEI